MNTYDGEIVYSQGTRIKPVHTYTLYVTYWFLLHLFDVTVPKVESPMSFDFDSHII